MSLVGTRPPTVQKLATECFENLVLMLPFTFLLFWTFEERIKKVTVF